MAEVTVKQLADTVGTPVDKLLEQLKDAGVAKTAADDLIADAEKSKLLSFLRQAHGVEKTASGASKITLKRKKRGEIKLGGPGRKAVTVETRGKRTYAKRDDSVREEMLRQTELRQQEAARQAATDAPKEAGAEAPAPSVSAEAKTPETAKPPVVEQTPEVVEAVDPALLAQQEAQAELDRERRKAEALVAAQEQIKRDAEQAIVAEADRVVAEADKARHEAEKAEVEARQEAERAQQAAADADAAAQAEREEEERLAREEEARAAAELAARRAVEAAALAELQQGVENVGKAKLEATRLAAEADLRRIEEEKRKAAAAKREKLQQNNPAPPPPDSGRAGRRGRGKAAGGRKELRVSGGRGGKREKRSKREIGLTIESKHAFAKPTEPVIRDVAVPETITVAELANRMAVKAGEVIKTMMGMGVMATINQMLDQDTAVLVVEEMGHRATMSSADDLELALQNKITATANEIPEEGMEARPPVVTIMGHVDHGKTSLLDYIRTTRVAAGEAGGITQHIGAYNVAHDKGTITFLDTPGHAAFTAMRARGAQATDIVVLVVAADDGAMPQTVEAVQHSRAAGVPMIVAVNKIDKEGSDPERVKNDLSQHEVIAEEWGGDTMFVHVSALTGQGIDELLDALLLQAEILELKATEEGPARGVVIEATLDKGRGPVATVMVQNGTLRRGDIMVCGKEFGRVRAMFDDAGNQVDSAGPSIPVQVLGLSNAPNAGEDMLVSKDERSARELAGLRNEKSRDARLADRRPAKLEDVFSQIKSGDSSTLNLLIKTDVQGSFEALRDSLEKMSTDEVTIRVVGGGVGGITESDAQLAAASNAVMIGFNVRADNTARRVINEQEIELHYDSVIYEVIDRVKASASGMLPPEIQERIIGLAEVKDVFRSPKFGSIAGSMVVDGVVKKSAPIRVLRDNVVIYEGELESLRRFKDDVNEVRMGTECGIGVKNYTDVRPGDQIEIFERKEVARSL
ncbi:translation initiation factor IF-2 [Chromatiales bacterium (ex Bugula neritina AB1)]|nr:translation initiation factor IF-2 [Chromatiales bacterium (ex Bugula neritina AB1)]